MRKHFPKWWADWRVSRFEAKKARFREEMEQLDEAAKMFAVNTDIEVLFGETAEEDSPYWDDPENWDPHDFEWKCKVEYLLYEALKVPRSEHAQFRRDHDISQGHQTLEWVLPSPPPEHTFDELPIIKEIDEEPHH